MRIISQNCAIDVPYEMSAIRNDDKLIILCMVGETGKGSVIATYSTSKKAEKAMDMLKEKYENNEFYHHMSTTDIFKETMVLLSNERFKEETSEYFQFPQDDEIEV